MPYHKSCLKRIRSSRKRNLRNRAGRSTLHTSVGKVLDSKNKGAGAEALKTAFSTIDKSVNKGLIHKNAGTNKKSRLMRFVNKLPE